MGEKQGSKLMRSLYAAFYSGSITQLWPLRDWLDRTERQKLPGYTAATAVEAEDAPERAAALALKRLRLLQWRQYTQVVFAVQFDQANLAKAKAEL